MNKEIKIMIGSIAFTLLLIVGFAFMVGGKEEDTQALQEVEGVLVTPQNIELGEVPINGGIVTKEYEVKNETSNNINLKKIATSCMCTEAKVNIGGNETKFYGMEHPGDKNPPVNLDLPSGETAKVTVTFDPAAHGPEGVGPFERVVYLTFSDPGGIKELTFEGTVVN